MLFAKSVIITMNKIINIAKIILFLIILLLRDFLFRPDITIIPFVCVAQIIIRFIYTMIESVQIPVVRQIN